MTEKAIIITGSAAQIKHVLSHMKMLKIEYRELEKTTDNSMVRATKTCPNCHLPYCFEAH